MSSYSKYTRTAAHAEDGEPVESGHERSDLFEKQKEKE